MQLLYQKLILLVPKTTDAWTVEVNDKCWERDQINQELGRLTLPQGQMRLDKIRTTGLLSRSVLHS